MERGKVVYHAAGAGNADCASCHVAYLPRAQWAGLMEKALGRKVDLFRVGPYTVQPRDSEPPVQVDTRGEPTQISKVLLPDFLVHPPAHGCGPKARRWSARSTPPSGSARTSTAHLAGVGGTARPTWKGAIPEENRWALAYSVQPLVRRRDADDARALKERLRASTAPVQ